jgi:hypothetical protein
MGVAVVLGLWKRPLDGKTDVNVRPGFTWMVTDAVAVE